MTTLVYSVKIQCELLLSCYHLSKLCYVNTAKNDKQIHTYFTSSFSPLFLLRDAGTRISSGLLIDHICV